jgi:hypothetical protein
MSRSLKALSLSLNSVRPFALVLRRSFTTTAATATAVIYNATCNKSSSSRCSYRSWAGPRIAKSSWIAGYWGANSDSHSRTTIGPCNYQSLTDIILSTDAAGVSAGVSTYTRRLSTSSAAWLNRHDKDMYATMAREQNLRSRAYFKLKVMPTSRP